MNCRSLNTNYNEIVVYTNDTVFYPNDIVFNPK